MIMIRVLVAFIIPLSLGIAATFCFFPNDGIRKHLLLKIFMAVGLGFGLDSSLYFIWSLIFAPNNNNFFFVEFLCLACLLLLLWRFSRKVREPVQGSNGCPHRLSRISSIVLIVLYIFLSVILISAIISFATYLANNPYGGWDAWAIWNMRARFIFRGQGQWLSSFQNYIGNPHADYPLLLPGIIARIWTGIGNDKQFVPAVVTIFFTLSTAGLLFSAIAQLRSHGQAIIATALLVGTPAFIFWGSSQEADVPLSFYFLATCILLFISDSIGHNRVGYKVMAGVMAGLSLWTKNEGWAFVLVVILLQAVFLGKRHDFKKSLKDLISFLGGISPVFIIAILFKAQIAPPNDLLAGQNPTSSFARLTDISRYLEITHAFQNLMSVLGGWGASLFFLMSIYLLLVGIRFSRQEKLSLVSLTLTLLLMLVSYFFVYITTPNPLEWHLQTSLNRLVLQLWPSFLFLFFMIVRSPEDIIAGQDNI
jgi:hypothetical protein